MPTRVSPLAFVVVAAAVAISVSLGLSNYQTNLLNGISSENDMLNLLSLPAELPSFAIASEVLSGAQLTVGWLFGTQFPCCRCCCMGHTTHNLQQQHQQHIWGQFKFLIDLQFLITALHGTNLQGNENKIFKENESQADK